MSFIKQITNNMYNVGDATSCMYARAYRPKEILPALIAAGVVAAGSLWGAKKSSDAAKEMERQMAVQKAENDAWYRRRYNEDYLDTAAGQNLVRQARELADRQTKKVDGAAALGGATDASVALAKENANKTISDTMANVAAQDTARKANADAIHHQDQQNYSNQQIALQQQRANNISTAASGLANAAFTAGSLIDGGNTKKSVS